MLGQSVIRCLIAGASLWVGVSAFADEVIVKLKPNQFQLFTTNFAGKEIKDRHAAGDLILIETKNHEELSRLKTDPRVEYAVSNIQMKAFHTPDDPSFSKQWALTKIRATEAWKVQKGSKEVVVAVIDTGVDWTHEDLKDQIWMNPKETLNGKDDDGNGYVDDIRGWDFRHNDNDPQDETSDRNPGHGTHCAGIVGAKGDNGTGISGAAQTVQLMPLRFLGADGSGDLMASVKAIDYATNNGAQIISASWGANVPRAGAEPIIEAIERAGAKNVIFVAAAANDGRNNDFREVYPANAGLDNVISVAASNVDDKKPTWSNFGRKKVDLASPGENIFSTIPGNKYRNLSGTSMATPLVSGLVALIVSQAMAEGKEYTPLEIRSILQASGQKVAIETACECRVDAVAALKIIQDEAMVIVPNAVTLALQDQKQFNVVGGEGEVTFTSSDPSVATITEDGKLSAKSKGEVLLTAKSTNGDEAVSQKIYIGEQEKPAGECPLQNPMLCQLMCMISPQLPWCQ